MVLLKHPQDQELHSRVHKSSSIDQYSIPTKTNVAYEVVKGTDAQNDVIMATSDDDYEYPVINDTENDFKADEIIVKESEAHGNDKSALGDDDLNHS